VREPSRAHWFNRLGHADAARVVCALEAVRQHDWLRITRTEDKRLTLRIAVGPNAVADPHMELCFGTSGQDMFSALATLNRQLSPAIVRRLRTSRTFRECVLLECARAWFDDDVEMVKGLLRRMTDATVGYNDLAALMETHPKSLVRMLSRMGNPSARHLIGIFARVARVNGVRFSVQVRETALRPTPVVDVRRLVDSCPDARRDGPDHEPDAPG
jgi:hypothetical protein